MMNMSQGSNSSKNPFKSMGMQANIIHGSTMIDDDEDNVDGMELAPSETSSMAE